jgi:E217 collar protein gp28
VPIFGQSLLKMAQRLIPPEQVELSKWLSNSPLTTGVKKPVFADPVCIAANVQAVPRTMYETLALDFQKDYVILYTSTPLRDLERNDGCDRIDYGGRRYTVESNTDWTNQDGWLGSICVDVGPST